MTKTRKIVLAAVAVLILALGGGFYFINKAAIGIPAFYVWKALSSRSHGGQYADINGVRIYYETYGEGPPVLVLHGGTGFIETMHYQISALAKDHLVIAPDSRGHGRSSDGEGPLHYTQMADDMVKLMDLLKVDKADVVGWSDGGNIGLILAMQHPDRVGRVVTSGANFNVAGLSHPPELDADPDGENTAPARDFYKRLAPDPAHWPVFYRKVLTMWSTEPNYTQADLAAIKAPVLVMAGEHDGIKRAHTDALAKAIPAGKEYIVMGASHFAPVEKPDVVNAEIAQFLTAP
ncbi:MAG: alpha/beta hydrolase [Parvibaculum sp.]|uniref:alpha/beta fold hydrolase n=1 Tax=Parvibaculum sp. TaxID=2024848 RepID=UPI0025D82794|nr:alpha/beta hydrolase [Parvibaculum sp.]MCE9651331.1 alpha/beta hydrolase [Parvibaculum sp.]